MPVYRVFVDEKDTGEYVIASSPQDAYADVATALPLTYESVVRLEEVASPEARPGLPAAERTLKPAGLSIPEQTLHLPNPSKPD